MHRACLGLRYAGAAVARALVAKPQLAPGPARATLHRLRTQGLSRSREKHPINLWITSTAGRETAGQRSVRAPGGARDRQT